MGTHDCKSKQLTKLIDKLLKTRSKMVNFQTNEDKLISFLSGFNQFFLSFLFVNILIGTMDGLGSNGIDDIIADDYDFEVKTALERTKNHSTFVAGLIILSFSAAIYVFVSRALQNARRLNISVLDVYIFN